VNTAARKHVTSGEEMNPFRKKKFRKIEQQLTLDDLASFL
jgi:hypothetical protein